MLLYILSLFTGPRYRPEIVWSDKSWTHNAFRVYEMLFGRKIGIRPEMSTFFDGGKVRYKIFTLEAFFAYIETIIRNLFNRQWVKVYQLEFASNPYGQMFPMISFAIALDTTTTYGTATGSGTSPITWSHTVTGSNPFLYIGTHTSSSSSSLCSVTAASYNAVGATKAQSDSSTVTFASESGVWFLGNPATGANTASVTFSGGVAASTYAGAVSYTGAQSGSTKDASNGTNGTGTGVKTVAVTTVASGCWVVCTLTNTGTTSTITAGNTQRWNNASNVNQARCGGEDTNGSVSPGSNNVSWTINTISTNFSMSAASFAPTAGGGPVATRSTLSMMGIG